MSIKRYWHSLSYMEQEYIKSAIGGIALGLAIVFALVVSVLVI